MEEFETQRNEDRGWTLFARRWVVAFFGVLGVLFLVLAVADPYNTLPFSPDLDRVPATTNQRFSYPAVAANPAFDSIVIGTSTTRLLNPDDLDRALGGRFANLSMNSGMPFEQSEILRLFLESRDAPATIIVGVDEVWCGATPAPLVTERPFPPWLYDGNPWNDVLHLFNFAALEQAGRQVAQMTGLREPKYRRDGYRNFLPPQDQYDLEKARGHIYRGPVRPLPPPETPPAGGFEAERRAMTFPDHDFLRKVLAGVPRETRIIVVGAPVHAIGIAAPGSAQEAKWQECMARLGALAGELAEAHVFDFRIRSQITTEDRNYWDSLHYGTQVAGWVVEAIGAGVRDGQTDSPLFRYARP